MADQVVVLEEAANDLADGMDFYERQKTGIGAYFFDSLLADIESLEISAGAHPVHFGLHRMLAKRFPFAVYYTLQDNVAVVVAVLDMRSNPAWMRNKVDNRR